MCFYNNRNTGRATHSNTGCRTIKIWGAPLAKEARPTTKNSGTASIYSAAEGTSLVVTEGCSFDVVNELFAQFFTLV